MALEQQQRNDQKGLVLKRIPIKELQLLYLNNQFVFRGVNVRADELITRGYSLIDGDENSRQAAAELIRRSGGENLFWQLSVNADVAGDSYLEKIPNKKGNKLMLLRHINPINFGYETVDTDSTRIKVDSNGNPVGYTQTIYDDSGKETKVPVNKEQIAHLKFNTFADEFNGISSIQPVYNTAIRLMNMELAAAEAAVKSAIGLLPRTNTSRHTLRPRMAGPSSCPKSFTTA